MNGLPTLTAPRGPLAVQARKSLSPDSQSSALGTIQVVTPDGLNLLLEDIDFGATGPNEIFQNVKFILLTEYFSVPLDRQFGMDFTMVDKPMQIAEAMLSQEVAMKIALYEPRCQFREISFDGNAVGGKLAPRVVVEILITDELPSRYPVPPTTSQAQLGQATVYAGTIPSFLDFISSLSHGPEGKPGPPGKPGPKGQRGSIWFNGTTDPPDPIPDSLPGDYWLNTVNGDVWEVS
jgi:hypothetical protein